MIRLLLGDEQLAAIVLHHHERFDGRGYPSRLRGELIPLGARIIAVADRFDGLTSRQPCRRAQLHEAAFAAVRAEAGTKLDPEAVRAFVSVYGSRRLAVYRAAERVGASVAGVAGLAGVAASIAALTGATLPLPSTKPGPPSTAIVGATPSSHQPAGPGLRSDASTTAPADSTRNSSRPGPQRSSPGSNRGARPPAGGQVGSPARPGPANTVTPVLPVNATGNNDSAPSPDVHTTTSSGPANNPPTISGGGATPPVGVTVTTSGSGAGGTVTANGAGTDVGAGANVNTSSPSASATVTTGAAGSGANASAGASGSQGVTINGTATTPAPAP
jgi:hypothetical protein